MLKSEISSARVYSFLKGIHSSNPPPPPTLFPKVVRLPCLSFLTYSTPFISTNNTYKYSKLQHIIYWLDSQK